MTEQFKNKNLLFYSNRDQASLTFLTELSKNQLLDQQFIKICINDPRVKIPQKIIQYNKIPVVVCQGFDQPIIGEDAFTWLQNNSFSEKSNGNLDFANVAQSSQLSNESSRLVQESQITDYNQQHNNEYNHGFANQNKTVNSQFSDINTHGIDQSRITTFDENISKKDSKSILANRMEQLKFQRENEFGSPKRSGGLEHNESYQNNQFRNNASSNASSNGGPLGAQLTAFGNMGSNLDLAYQPPPMSDKKLNDNRSNSSRNQQLQYNPNVPNVPNLPGGPPPNALRPHSFGNNRPPMGIAMPQGSFNGIPQASGQTPNFFNFN